MSHPVRSALFVDFDNIYSDLQKLDATSADEFATNPGIWVKRLENGEDVDGLFTRRFLVRACYLNPSVHSKHRSFFTRAGFRVIDCPSLTRQGKSSADIHLVIDALDALAHNAHYEEFIVCSADADFTPLMVRLRANDRRTVMVAGGLTAAAYRATCDEIIDSSQLVSSTGDILSVIPETPDTSPVGGEDPAALQVSQGPGELMHVEADVEAAVNAVRQAVAGSAVPIAGASAAGAALRAQPGVSENNWSGTGGFAQFVAKYSPELRFGRSLSGGWVSDPGRHSVDPAMATEEENSTIESKVSRVTEVPRLTHEQYRNLFIQLSMDLEEEPFNLTYTPRRIRERTAIAGAPVSRSAALAVTRELRRAGVRLERPATADALATAWRDRVLDLCEAARMELSDEERLGIDGWLLVPAQISNS